MMVFSGPAQSPDAKLDCFPLQDQTAAKTALVFEQRVRRTFGYPRHAPFRLTVATVSQHQFWAEDFRSWFD